MDDWLMQKKIDEAERVAHMRDLDRREELEKHMREERKTNSYKDWMRLQTSKKKQTRKYKNRQQNDKDDVMARQLAQQEEMMHMRRQGYGNDGQYQEGMDDEMDMEGEDGGIDQYQ